MKTLRWFGWSIVVASLLLLAMLADRLAKAAEKPTTLEDVNPGPVPYVIFEQKGAKKWTWYVRDDLGAIVCRSAVVSESLPDAHGHWIITHKIMTNGTINKMEIPITE